MNHINQSTLKDLMGAHRDIVENEVNRYEEHAVWVPSQGIGEGDAYIEDIKRKIGLMLVQKDRMKESYRKTEIMFRSNCIFRMKKLCVNRKSQKAM